MSDALPTTCLNCGLTENLTTLETLDRMKTHGPGKCKPQETDNKAERQ